MHGQRGRQERIQAPGERTSTTAREGCRGTTRPEGCHRHRNGGAAMHRHRERAGRRGRNGTRRHRGAGTGPRSVTAAERRGREGPGTFFFSSPPMAAPPPPPRASTRRRTPRCSRARLRPRPGLRTPERPAVGTRAARTPRTTQAERVVQAERAARAGRGRWQKGSQSGAPKAAQSPSRRGPDAQSTLRYCGAA